MWYDKSGGKLYPLCLSGEPNHVLMANSKVSEAIKKPPLVYTDGINFIEEISWKELMERIN
jgi:hypothetical protein